MKMSTYTLYFVTAAAAALSPNKYIQVMILVTFVIILIITAINYRLDRKIKTLDAEVHRQKEKYWATSRQILKYKSRLKRRLKRVYR